MHGKQFKLLLRSIIEKLLKMGSQEGKEECSDFIKQFFIKDIVQGGFGALCDVTTTEDGKKETLIKNKFFKDDDQAVSYGNPCLFYYLSRLFLSQ